MKNVLYIGNALSKKGKTITSVEVLSRFLEDFCDVKVASNKSNKILRLLDMIYTLIKHRRKTDYVLIDTYSTLNYYYAFVIGLLSRWLGLNYIPILRGGNLERRLKHNPRLSHVLFYNAHRLVAPSPFLESIFKTYGYTNVLYIPNAIELDHYKFQNRAIDTIKILWVRSFSAIYNPKMAVLVLQSLLKKGYKANLTMVGPEGDGSLASTRDFAAFHGLVVNFTGNLSKAQWITLSKGCNVFINTTNFDNTPVSVIEAMALGLPIVSTNVGGLPHLISNKKDGILVLPSDARAMVNAIIDLRENDQYRLSCIKNARQKVERFDWKHTKSQWERLLS